MWEIFKSSWVIFILCCRLWLEKNIVSAASFDLVGKLEETYLPTWQPVEFNCFTEPQTQLHGFSHSEKTSNIAIDYLLNSDTILDSKQGMLVQSLQLDQQHNYISILSGWNIQFINFQPFNPESNTWFDEFVLRDIEIDFTQLTCRRWRTGTITNNTDENKTDVFSNSVAGLSRYEVSQNVSYSIRLERRSNNTDNNMLVEDIDAVEHIILAHTSAFVGISNINETLSQEAPESQADRPLSFGFQRWVRQGDRGPLLSNLKHMQSEIGQIKIVQTSYKEEGVSNETDLSTDQQVTIEVSPQFDYISIASRIVSKTTPGWFYSLVPIRPILNQRWLSHFEASVPITDSIDSQVGLDDDGGFQSNQLDDDFEATYRFQISIMENNTKQELSSANDTTFGIVDLAAVSFVENGVLPPENSIALYEISFESNWNSRNHPFAFPTDASFDTHTFVAHKSDFSLWRAGGEASTGIQQIAEAGKNEILLEELGENPSVGEITKGFGGTIGIISLTESFPYLSAISRMNPSPDWFVGVDRLSLVENGEWVSTYSIDLEPIDAGTNDGRNYTDRGSATSEPIHYKTTSNIPQDSPVFISQFAGQPFVLPFGSYERVLPVGRYRFTLVATPSPSSSAYPTSPSASPMPSASLEPSLSIVPSISTRPSSSNVPSSSFVPSESPEAPSLSASPSFNPTLSAGPSRSMTPSELSILPTEAPSSITEQEEEENEDLNESSSSQSLAPSNSIFPTSTPSRLPSLSPSQSPRPSTQPSTFAPTITYSPTVTHIPTGTQTPTGTLTPTVANSLSPTFLFPSTSLAPSTSLQPSLQPSTSQVPSLSLEPSQVPSLSQRPSVIPSIIPSELPSTPPTLSIEGNGPFFSLIPSEIPSTSFAPSTSNRPSQSTNPSSIPSVSNSPSTSRYPSQLPSFSIAPSFVPSVAQTNIVTAEEEIAPGVNVERAAENVPTSGVPSSFSHSHWWFLGITCQILILGLV